MSKKVILLAVFLSITAVCIAFFVGNSRKMRIEKFFRYMTKLVSKETDETDHALKLRSIKASEFLADKFSIKTRYNPFLGEFSQPEAVSLFIRFYGKISRLKVRFFNLNIRGSKENAVFVNTTVMAEGSLNNGQIIREAFEVDCVLIRAGKKWKLRSFDQVDVLEK
ncbi:hypothetical protein ACFLTD_04555 [Elusimicrobiota bacterium]